MRNSKRVSLITSPRPARRIVRRLPYTPSAATATEMFSVSWLVTAASARVRLSENRWRRKRLTPRPCDVVAVWVALNRKHGHLGIPNGIIQRVFSLIQTVTITSPDQFAG